MNRVRMTDLKSSWEGYVVLFILNICYDIIRNYEYFVV